MARLPTPGADDGTWGSILNDFLAQAHNTDGSIKPDAVDTSAIADSTITEAKLDSAVQTKLNTVAPVTSVNTQTGAVTLTKSDVGLANVDNTSDANKPVSSATQTALNAKSNTGHTHVSTDITDLTEAAQDIMGAAIVAGSNISVNYNDTAGTVTIAATASGGTNATNLSTNTDATTVTVMSDTGTDAVIGAADGSNAGILTSADKTKLDGIASGATANSSDATLLNRANHTGTQTASTISDFDTAADARITAAAGTSVQAHDTDLTTIAGLTPNNDDILQRKAGAWTNRSVAQYKTDLALTSSDVGLANVDNTSDSTKNSAAVTLTNKTISGASNTLSNISQSSVTNLTTDLTNKLAVKNSNPQLTDSTNDRFSRIDIADDATPTGSWPDRLVFYFNGVRTGYHNEYGELRARPAKTNTVSLRAMGHGSGSTGNIFEVAPNSSGTEMLAVSASQITATVPFSSTSTVSATNIDAKVTASSSAPSSPAVGDVWIDLSS